MPSIITPTQHATSFVSSVDESALATVSKFCEHKRDRKSYWKCNPCSACKRKGACEHRRTRNRQNISERAMLATLIAQAQNKSHDDCKSPVLLLHRRIVIYDSGCSTAMVSCGWLKRYPDTLTNITKNPTIRIATASGITTSQYTGSICFPTSNNTQIIRCRILEIDSFIPPLFGDKSLPDFTYKSNSGIMELTSKGKLEWRHDPQTNLRFICLMTTTEEQNIRDLIHTIHCDVNHATARDV